MTTMPLGATLTKNGATFSLFSAHADAVQLCLFDGDTETDRIALVRHGDIWSVEVPNIKAGQHYGYRVEGPYAPHDGHRFNAHKLLIDPYAKALHGVIQEHPAIYGHIGDDDLSFDTQDSAPFMPKGIVTPPITLDNPPRLNTPWANTILYEAHAKGLTQRHPTVPKTRRGTVDALGDPAIIDYLTDLGITALELLPLQQFHSEPHLTHLGLSNYWGYNPVNYFVPHSAYLGPQSTEGLKASIAALHAAGIEVILDVVYNHTAESWHLGPTLSYKGIDNLSYYALQNDKRFYVNHTGTGNMLDMRTSAVRDLTLESLRYWVSHYGIDGFRFDLAPTLGRMGQGFDASGPLFDAIASDPILSSVKLIAEPWDIGPGGYQLGQFPQGWAEWNDEYRDAVRSFWRGDNFAQKSLAGKLLGSAERFDHDGKPAWSSINLLAAHDGFTLHDTVSFNHKHNLANGEDNRDGHGHNLSDNMGVEGATTDLALTTRRQRRKIAMLATLLLSQGTPMLLAGDEMGQSQSGNNNAYCQDNETTWLDWADIDDALIETVRALIKLRRDYPHFRQANFLHGQILEDTALPNVAWITPSGELMQDQDWDTSNLSCLGLALAMAGQPTLALFLNRGTSTRIELSDSWSTLLGERSLVGDGVAVFELPAGSLPDWDTATRLAAHAEAKGLHTGFHDINGQWHPMAPDTRAAILDALDINLVDPPQRTSNPPIETIPVYGAKALSAQGAVWGVTTALYALHSARSWGIGDFEDLAQLAEYLATQDCQFLGINPVHALFPSAPHLYAPYSVSSREFLNIMHIAPDKIPEWDGTRPNIPKSEYVDYDEVYAAKTAAFRAAWTQFSSLPKTHARHIAFNAFKTERGESMHLHVLYDVIFEDLPRDQQTYAGWQNFPAELHNPRSPAARDFARQHADRLNYYAYLQWNAHDQLTDAHTRARAAGMSIGLYLDLAVGVTPGSSDVWRNREAFAQNISLGAPGDAANPDGQRWNLLPLRPDKFEGDAPAAHVFRTALRRIMTQSGAIRIDHVLGLLRSFWIPETVAGGYISYPFDRLLQIVSEESHAAQCVVFGEDLGTVPEGFRDRMTAHGLMGCCVQMIERGMQGEILPREAARKLAMTAWSNHDFPTVQGFWTERDLDWRVALNIGIESLDSDRHRRANDRATLSHLCGLGATPAQLSTADMAKLQAYLAQSPSLAFAVQLDDLMTEVEQPNVPGTTSEQPNWRRRAKYTLEAFAKDDSVDLILEAIRNARRLRKSKL